MNDIKSSGLFDIVAQAIEEMKQELGTLFSVKKINLSELSRKTGISRGKLRTLQKHNFEKKEHSVKLKKSEKTVLTGFTGVIDDYLRKNVKNSEVIFFELQGKGYKGGRTQIKVYIKEHKDLLPAKRQMISPQGSRGRRYTTGPGEAYQMDWGFINVESENGKISKVSCFAMICHHCGERYIEFFYTARQENLFIGMVHAFIYMGIPQRVITDNMKSVVIRRDENGRPIWQKDYEEFMNTVGFKTTLCKPRHPFTKGKVERLVRFVKENFAAGRTFHNLNDLNSEALAWCDIQNGLFHKAVNCVPHKKHMAYCSTVAREIPRTFEIAKYLCPTRQISFDGFVSYEGQRFGVPYWYEEHSCRVKRDNETLYIYNMELTKILSSHPVTWNGEDSFCHDQYLKEQPEEHPSTPVKNVIRQTSASKRLTGFSRFNFDTEEEDL